MSGTIFSGRTCFFGYRTKFIKKRPLLRAALLMCGKVYVEHGNGSTNWQYRFSVIQLAMSIVSEIHHRLGPHSSQLGFEILYAYRSMKCILTLFVGEPSAQERERDFEFTI